MGKNIELDEDGRAFRLDRIFGSAPWMKANEKQRHKTNPNKGEPGQKAKDRAEDKASKLAEAEEAAPAAEEATEEKAEG